MEINCFNPKELSFDCDQTWNLICDGKTKGVFQLESNLGRSWAKRVKPRDIEELAALISVIRPGCLKAIQDGKSMTQHFVDRKNGTDQISYIHNSLEPILSNTQGVLVYQEQSMKIAQQLAGFSLQEADNLRKAIGKKKADLMAKIKTQFIKGAENEAIVSREAAEEIFGWIEKSSRYAFNKSHAISYAICAYWSAYAKAHFPLEFYKSYLYHSEGKQDSQQEVKELISDAKINGINVFPPSFKHPCVKFSIHEEHINFGFQDVKFIGQNQITKLNKAMEEVESFTGKRVGDFSWYEFLLHMSDRIGKQVSIALVSVGAISYTGVARSKMLYELETWRSLTAKEKEWCVENCAECHSLIECLNRLAPTKKDGGGTSNKNRCEVVKNLIYLTENPPYPLTDDPHFISNKEQEYLGVSITYSKIDSCDVTSANSTCKEILDGKKGKSSIAVEVKRVAEWNIKKGKSAGKQMAFLTVEDNTCELDDVVVFPDAWEEYASLLSEQNTVIISGETQKNKDGFVVNKVHQI